MTEKKFTVEIKPSDDDLGEAGIKLRDKLLKQATQINEMIKKFESGKQKLAELRIQIANKKIADFGKTLVERFGNDFSKADLEKIIDIKIKLETEEKQKLESLKKSEGENNEAETNELSGNDVGRNGN